MNLKLKNSPIDSCICLHTAKKTDQKRSTKNVIIYFSYAKATKVQRVLKTDQRADVSAHALFKKSHIHLGFLEGE